MAIPPVALPTVNVCTAVPLMNRKPVFELAATGTVLANAGSIVELDAAVVERMDW